MRVANDDICGHARTVFGKRDGTPGEGFYTLLKELGLIKSSKTDKALHLWAEHVAKAHQWYVSHPDDVA